MWRLPVVAAVALFHLLLLLQAPPGFALAAPCVLQPREGVVANPYVLAGLNDVLGPIINLTYSDTAVMAAVKALRLGVLRHPGGTVANYWNMTNGSYVSPCSTEHYDFCAFQDRIDALPRQTFTPKEFMAGIGSACTAASTGPIWDLNVFTMSVEEASAQLDLLSADGVPVTKIEIGNEFYIDKQYGWQFPSPEAYMAKAAPVIAHARRLFPNASIAVVASSHNASWNEGIAKHSELFDAVTLHDYSPGQNELKGYPEQYRIGVLVGWGDASMKYHASQLRAVFGPVEVWRTEYNVPSGNEPLLPLINGGAHAFFVASHILAAVEHTGWAVPFTVLQLHAFLSQDGTGWDGKSGVVKVGQQSNNVTGVRFGGVAQVMSHVAFVSTSLHSRMHALSVPEDTCPQFPIPVREQPRLSCLQVAVFSGPPLRASSNGPDRVLFSFVALNKCNQSTIATLEAPTNLSVGSKMALEFDSRACLRNLTSYSATDPGGWAPLPADPAAALPWTTGPLSPRFTPTQTVEDASAITLTLASLSLTIGSVVQASSC